jgi:hypothetical protein
MEAEPVTGTFVLVTTDNKGVSCVKLRVNTVETCLPTEAWTEYASATLRLDLPTIHDSDIQLLSNPALPKIRDLDETPNNPIEYPAIVTSVAPEDGIEADLMLEITHFEKLKELARVPIEALFKDKVQGNANLSPRDALQFVEESETHKETSQEEDRTATRADDPYGPNMVPNTEILNVPVAAIIGWVLIEDNRTAENDMFVVIDDAFTPNDTKTASNINEPAADFEAKQESLIQWLWSDDEMPKREVRTETSNTPNLLPNNVMEIDPEVGSNIVATEETLTTEKLTAEVVIEEICATVTCTGNLVP